jgi:hypothetical protein
MNQTTTNTVVQTQETLVVFIGACYLAGLYLFVLSTQRFQAAQLTWHHVGNLPVSPKFPAIIRNAATEAQMDAIPLYRRRYTSGAFSHRIQINGNTYYLTNTLLRRVRPTVD